MCGWVFHCVGVGTRMCALVHASHVLLNVGHKFSLFISEGLLQWPNCVQTILNDSCFQFSYNIFYGKPRLSAGVGVWRQYYTLFFFFFFLRKQGWGWEPQSSFSTERLYKKCVFCIVHWSCAHGTPRDPRPVSPNVGSVVGDRRCVLCTTSWRYTVRHCVFFYVLQ